MTQPDRRDTAPGMGDPTRSDDIDSAGLRDGLGGRGSPERLQAPAPQAGDGTEIRSDPDPGRSGPQGGQLGSSGGGYGTGSDAGTSTGGPDGADVQAATGPGPQTDWLRGEGAGATGERSTGPHSGHGETGEVGESGRGSGFQPGPTAQSGRGEASAGEADSGALGE